MKVCIFLLCLAVAVRAYDGSSSGLSNYGARDRGAASRSINFGGNSGSQRGDNSQSEISASANIDQSQATKGSQSEAWQSSMGDKTNFKGDLNFSDNNGSFRSGSTGQGTTDIPLNAYWKTEDPKWLKNNESDSINPSEDKTLIKQSDLQKILEQSYGDIFKFPKTQDGVGDQPNGNSDGSSLVNNAQINNDPYRLSYGNTQGYPNQNHKGYNEALANGHPLPSDLKANSESPSNGNHTQWGKGHTVTIVPLSGEDTAKNGDLRPSSPSKAFDIHKGINFDNKQSFNRATVGPFCPFPGFPCGNAQRQAYDSNINNFYHNIFKRGASHYNSGAVMNAPPCPTNYIINCKATLSPVPCSSPSSSTSGTCNGHVSYGGRSANTEVARNVEGSLNSDGLSAPAARTAITYEIPSTQRVPSIQASYGGSSGGSNAYSSGGNTPASYGNKGNQSPSVSSYGGSSGNYGGASAVQTSPINNYNGRPGGYGGNQPITQGPYSPNGGYGAPYAAVGNPSAGAGYGGSGGYRFARHNSNPNPLFLNFQKVNLC